MSRYRGPVCRLCRRYGAKLFLKGDRCYTDKCAMEKRPYPPGVHGRLRSKVSDYSFRLKEKQKLRSIYGLNEKQFKRFFEKADRMKGITGENFIVLLERRLDNVVFRLGFAFSRAQARQLVVHGHFLVNGRKVDRPSYLVKVGDTIELREKSRNIEWIAEAMDAALTRGIPSWLELYKEKFSGKVIALPKREDVDIPVQEQLVVEFYSK